MSAKPQYLRDFLVLADAHRDEVSNVALAVVPSAVAGKNRRIYGLYVPHTDQKMFAQELRDDSWNIIHVSTGARLLHVDTLFEALRYAKEFYDIAVKESIPLDATNAADIAGWHPALVKHEFKFEHERAAHSA
jgi:hypothetical protein